MLVTVAIVVSFVSVAAGLPGDWARRHSRRAALLAQGFNVLGIVAVVAAAATLGLASGVGAAIAVVVGVAAGQALADRIATAAWGPVA